MRQTNRYVLYFRVSTQKQGRSGLGLDAQKRDIDLYLENYSEQPYEILGTFKDIQSGADNDRPELKKAIELAKKTKSILLVQKICRLSRRVSFIASLIEDKELDFKVAQMPFADKFQLHIYSALNEQEKDFISSRTKSALRSWKERNPDKKLGAPVHHIKALAKARRAKALKEAKRIEGLIVPLKQQGKSLRVICDVLNNSGITTSKGRSFYPSKVSRTLSILEVA
jgi:DNA invertase Pin-like site-specific DNA recombinase|tara:strand:- start:4056 stop:4733 length:678 start_codon:yes stop_codon:yes gene_type:complete